MISKLTTAALAVLATFALSVPAASAQQLPVRARTHHSLRNRPWSWLPPKSNLPPHRQPIIPR